MIGMKLQPLQQKRPDDKAGTTATYEKELIQGGASSPLPLFSLLMDTFAADLK